jgi:hypothetical protein
MHSHDKYDLGFCFSVLDLLSLKENMGKGGHNTRIETSHDQQIDSTSPHRLPTLSEIKVKLPAHCFRPTVRQSMSYVIKDFIYITFTFILMYQIQKLFKYGFLFFPIYWYMQGLFIFI